MLHLLSNADGMQHRSQSLRGGSGGWLDECSHLLAHLMHIRGGAQHFFHPPSYHPKILLYYFPLSHIRCLRVFMYAHSSHLCLWVRPRMYSYIYVFPTHPVGVYARLCSSRYYLLEEEALQDAPFMQHRLTPHGLTPHGLTPHGFSPHGLSPHGLTPLGLSTSVGLRVAGLRVAGLRVAGLRVAGIWVARK